MDDDLLTDEQLFDKCHKDFTEELSRSKERLNEELLHAPNKLEFMRNKLSEKRKQCLELMKEMVKESSPHEREQLSPLVEKCLQRKLLEEQPELKNCKVVYFVFSTLEFKPVFFQSMNMTTKALSRLKMQPKFELMLKLELSTPGMNLIKRWLPSELQTEQKFELMMRLELMTAKKPTQQSNLNNH